MTKIGDKEIMYTLLNEHKVCASSLTNLILESSNQALRNDAAGILSRTFQHQNHLRRHGAEGLVYGTAGKSAGYLQCQD